jgi:hypothetical protein
VLAAGAPTLPAVPTAATLIRAGAPAPPPLVPVELGPLLGVLSSIAATGRLPAARRKWDDRFGLPHRPSSRRRPRRTFGPADTVTLVGATAAIQGRLGRVVPSTWGTMSDWQQVGARVAADQLGAGFTLSSAGRGDSDVAVYHVTQLAGYRLPAIPHRRVPAVVRAAVEALDRVGVPSTESFHNSYAPFRDAVTLLPGGLFTHPVHWVKSYAHELAHASGHPTRLDRPTLTADVTVGDPVYRAEEATAELCAVAVTLRLFGGRPTPVGLRPALRGMVARSAVYVWRQLPDDPLDRPRVLAAALASASAATDWVAERAGLPPSVAR